jgi:thiol-disulfide isomerase/thioredoxin
MVKKIFSLLFVIGISFSNAKGEDIPKWKISDLETYIKNSNKPTVVNFWATFCKPCIAEIPHFQKLVKQYEKDGVQLLLVSLDMIEMYPVKIKMFADKFGFTAPIVFLDETNADIFCPRVDSTWSGAIPASLFINNTTGYRKFFEEEMSEEKFEIELKALIAVDANKKIAVDANKKQCSLLPVLLLAVVLISLIVLWYIRRNGKS